MASFFFFLLCLENNSGWSFFAQNLAKSRLPQLPASHILGKQTNKQKQSKPSDHWLAQAKDHFIDKMCWKHKAFSLLEKTTEIECKKWLDGETGQSLVSSSGNSNINAYPGFPDLFLVWGEPFLLIFFFFAVEMCIWNALAWAQESQEGIKKRN